MKRRQTLKALSALPLLALFPSVAISADKKAAPGKDTKATSNLIDEKDTLANAMQYKHDATQAAMRTDKTAICTNCAKYNVCMEGDKECKPLSAAALKKSDVAPCQIFKGKVVKGSGWCLSWQKKA